MRPAELLFEPKRHAYSVNGAHYPSITQVAVTDYSMVPIRVLKKACERGIAVHRACELFDLGKLDWATLDDTIAPYLDAWIQFVKEYEVVFEPETIEVPEYHPIARYAGTADRGSRYGNVWVRGERSLVEIKSLTGKLTRATELQTSAQEHLINFWKRREGKPLIERRWAVRLDREGKFHPVLHENKSDIGVFLAYVTVLHEEVAQGKCKYPAEDLPE